GGGPPLRPRLLRLSQATSRPRPRPRVGRAGHAGGHGRASLSPQVCEPPESKRPTRHWSLSIEERRQLAVQGGWEEPGTTGTPIHRRDIRQLVARLVSEDVDRDVLLPHPLRSSEAALTFHAFLARSAPFWQRVTWAAQVSRSPPS
uniref:Testis expressed 22 n=2 Tax=Canis lupus familiaris TaxID=9615 RepID=A0A8C0MB85_CANLF